MAKIAVLAPQVANMIAAGEVVERPASVVKELMENAIDAGATGVTVEIRNGGVTYLRVSDDGSGMEAEDARTAFLRHATSKIRNEGDLDAIYTLGFRGEALAAIAAVSKVDLFTKPHGAALGTHIALEGGAVLEEEETGCPDGTTVVIKDLFYNTPARMKFLKKDSTESSYVEAAVEHVALAHPELTIKFIKDGKEGLYTPGDGSMLSVIYAIYGRDFTRDLVALSGAQRDVQVGGYVSRPSFSRANRSMQNFFVNGRYIRSKLLTAAVEQAYHGRLTGGRFPACFLDIHINTSAVDVNVHPAKLEVKFSHEREVFSAVYQFITAALDGTAAFAEEAALPPPPEEPALPKMPYRPRLFTFPETAAQGAAPLQSGEAIQYQTKLDRVAGKPVPAPAGGRPPAPAAPAAREGARILLGGGAPAAPPVERGGAPAGAEQSGPPVQAPAAPQGRAAPESLPVPDFRVIGEAFSTYILVQMENSLLLIDKHAGHERMIYNKLQDRVGGTDSQALLAPESVTLSRPEKNALLEHGEELRQAGFELEDFGEGTVIVRQVPMYLEAGDIGYVLSDIAGKLLDKRQARADAYDAIIKSVSCKAAVKAGTFTDDKEREKFVAALLADPQVRSCPHGRPVLFTMTRGDIEKQFKRIL